MNGSAAQTLTGPVTGSPSPRSGEGSGVRRAPLSSQVRARDTDESDAQLLHRVSEGDLGPLGVLYDRHHDSVRQFVRRATAGGADVDDITHEPFLALAGAASRYDGRASARPLLIGIAALLVRQHRRGVARFFQVLTSFSTGFGDRSVRTPEDAASVTEHLVRFEQALARLPQEKRLVLLLIEREGLSGEEVAQALQVPLNTVWTRLHYARVELRKALGIPAPARD
jgi:RNA polymerase sigma factor (sigma-70 family)